MKKTTDLKRYASELEAIFGRTDEHAENVEHAATTKGNRQAARIIAAAQENNFPLDSLIPRFVSLSKTMDDESAVKALISEIERA